MKKIILLFALFITINPAFSQSIKFSVFGGVNESNAFQMPTSFLRMIAIKGETFPNSNLTGFHVGTSVDFYFDKISIQPNLIYSTKGGMINQTSLSYNESYDRTDELRLNYLEMPINILYHLPLGIGNLFIGGGPFVGIGISGTVKYTITSIESGTKVTSTGSEDIKYGSGYNDIKNPDYGLNTECGLIFKNKLFLKAGYELGLANISNIAQYKGHNRVLSFSAGYSF